MSSPQQRTGSQHVIGVVIPVYNGARMLPDTLSSLLGQRLPAGVRVHAFLIDDGSSDDSASWCREVAAAWTGAWAGVGAGAAVGSPTSPVDVSVEVLPENRGRAAARNRGVERALEAGCSELTFLDQDDILPCDSLARRLAWLNGSTAPIAHGRQSFFVVPGIERPRWCRPEWLAAPQVGNVLGAMLMRAHVWNTIGPFDPELRHGSDDADWFMRLRRLQIDADHHDPVVLIRRVHDRNGSADPRARRELSAIVRRHLAGRARGGSP